MKYKLINNQTKEEHLCDKVTIDEFDYYVNNEHKTNTVYIPKDGIIMEQVCDSTTEEYKQSVRIFGNKNHLFVLATNNPNIDIPKVKEMSDYLAKQLNKQSFDDYGYPKWDEGKLFHRQMGFIDGYNKSQETHFNSDEDMIEFTEWVAVNYVPTTASKELKYWQKGTYQNKEYFYSTQELLQLWKEQQPKVLFYE